MGKSLISLEIDGIAAEVRPGSSLLDAARSVGIDIPTMCAVDGYPHIASCMVCVVADRGSGRLMAACATRAEPGMAIDTATDEVKAARRANLELLLSEHVGDCEGPCRRICPADMDIPLMMSHLEGDDAAAALAVVKQRIPLPAVLGRICPAPCEKGCRSAQLDGPLSIRELEKYVGDLDLAAAQPFLPVRLPDSGRRVAIVGAGPTGLSAAYFLLIAGHRCTIFDEQEEPGGMLRYGIAEDKLPHPVIDGEIGVIRRLGLEFRLGCRVGEHVAWEGLRTDFDALILAGGDASTGELTELGVTLCRTGVEVFGPGLRTAVPGVFAGGGAIRPGRIAVRSVAQGRVMAAAVGQYLDGDEIVGAGQEFSSWIGRLLEVERQDLAAGRHTPLEQVDSGAGAATEASRCLHCECLKKVSCLLRRHSDAHDADQRRFRSPERARVNQIRQHERVVFEPGKCIRCGVCVRITEQHGEPLGLSFIGRGFDLRIGVPFNASLDVALQHTADLCVQHCPTGALAHPEGEK